MDKSRHVVPSAIVATVSQNILVSTARLYVKKDSLKFASEVSDSVSAVLSATDDASETVSFSSSICKLALSTIKLDCEAVSCVDSDDESAFSCPEIVSNRVISAAEMV